MCSCDGCGGKDADEGGGEFQAKFFGGPVSAIKKIIDMIRGKIDFDPVQAILSSLELAKAVVTVAAPERSPFGPLSIDVDEELPIADAPKFENDEATKEFMIAGLTQMLPPNERGDDEAEFAAKIAFPVDVVTQVVLMWTLNKVYNYVAEKWEDVKEDDGTSGPTGPGAE